MKIPDIQKNVYLYKSLVIIVEFSASSNYDYLPLKVSFYFYLFHIKGLTCMNICRVLFIPYRRIKRKN